MQGNQPEAGSKGGNAGKRRMEIGLRKGISAVFTFSLNL
jgi:hypothetical protein